MGEPFIGEIRMFGGNFAPAGWAFCQGQLMAISENDAFFNLIGTTYGGDGQETFGIPDLQGRVPIHSGTGSDGITYTLGEKGGVETATLTVQQIPVHTHPLIASTNLANDANPLNNVLAEASSADPYATFPPTIAMAPQSVTPVGGSQPHENIQPYLCISFIISLFGVFPQQN